MEVALYYPKAEQSLWGEDKAYAAAPVGAVVVAQGAGDIGVRLRLARAVQTLLGVPQDAVEVFVMQPNET